MRGTHQTPQTSPRGRRCGRVPCARPLPPPPPRRTGTTLFFARIGGTTEDTLRRVCEAYGAVKDVTIMTNKATGRTKSCGFVKFISAASAAECFAAAQRRGTALGRRGWVVEWAKSSQIREKDLDKTTLFVTGIGERVTEEMVLERFGRYGGVERVTIRRGKEQGDCFAFVKFGVESDARRALERENGAVWNGEVIGVEYSEAMEAKRMRRQLATMRRWEEFVKTGFAVRKETQEDDQDADESSEEDEGTCADDDTQWSDEEMGVETRCESGASLVLNETTEKRLLEELLEAANDFTPLSSIVELNLPEDYAPESDDELPIFREMSVRQSWELPLFIRAFTLCDDSSASDNGE